MKKKGIMLLVSLIPLPVKLVKQTAIISKKPDNRRGLFFCFFNI